VTYTTTIRRVSRSIAKVYCLNKESAVISTGSGFLYAKKGMLVSCDHLVEGSHSLICSFPDDGEQEFHPLKVVVRDPEHDLALLRVDVDHPFLTPLSKKSSRNVRSGMPVLFSGYPLSLDVLTTHQGILSAITKDAVGVTTYLIDGTVNSGNSGCPLMNEQGEVLGVVNAKRRERSDLLNKVEAMSIGGISLHGIDLVEIYQALISNVQLGIGYAVPASYIPEHKGMKMAKKKSSPAKVSKALSQKKR
jgi:S1-C subfamily serine protease